MGLGAVLTAVTLLLTVIVAWRWQPVIARQTNDRRELIPVPVIRWDWQQFAMRLETAVSRHWRPCLLAIVFVGFGLRLFGLGLQELRGDEAFSYLFAREPVAEIVPNLLSEGDPHSPLHYLLLHGWMRLVGDSEVALRYLSLLPGVLLLPLLAQLGRRIRGRSFALTVTLLVAISQSLVWISQDVRNQYTLDLFFIVAATLLLTWLVDGGRNRTRKNSDKRRFFIFSWKWGWVGYAVLCALAVYSHYSAVFALLGHGVFILAYPPYRKRFWVWGGAGLLAMLLFLPWGMTILTGKLAAGHLSNPGTPELAKYLTAVGIEMMAGSAVTGGWLRWLFLGGVMLSVVGARQLWQEHKGWAGLLLTWLWAMLLFLYLIQFSREIFNLYYVTISVPVWWLLIVIGVQQLGRSRRGWQWGTAVFSIILFIIVSGVSLRNYYTDPQFSRSRGYRPMAAHVAEEMQPGDLFLAHFPDPSLVYYLRNLAIDYTMQPSHYQLPAEETRQELAELAADYDRIWFVPAPGPAWDTENVVPAWLDTHTLREQEAHYDQLLLSAHLPDHAIDGVTLPIERQLGDTIQLESVFVMVNGKPVDLELPFTPSPDSQLVITLLWQTSAPIVVHYTVFVQVLDENGMLVVQDDSVPANGVRPTETWLPNETILDTHTLVLPADRVNWQGQIIVGMYETETVERVLFAGGGDMAVIATIQVP
ncbi:MAG: hypothetical protein DWQ04_33320 [Chloroflexi bacterium]|nr:MAG: hypothetical protein DWQ04_33320 [Chloroflexota bacterium]